VDVFLQVLQLQDLVQLLVEAQALQVLEVFWAELLVVQLLPQGQVLVQVLEQVLQVREPLVGSNAGLIYMHHNLLPLQLLLMLLVLINVSLPKLPLF
jgi:hypothetical protein